MIPKVIHYCWFGGAPKNQMIQKCISSWKTYCPDYEIIEWNETNYDVKKHSFTRQAYEAGKWAFVSDYARIDILYQYGGIYLDTDVELIKSLDRFLKYDFFAGFQNRLLVAFGLGFGSAAGHPVLKEILDVYDNLTFQNNEFGQIMTSCPRIQTEALKNHGLICNNRNQVVDGCHIFCSEVFCPMSFRTGKVKVGKHTVSIHHYDMSWMSEKQKKMQEREWRLMDRFGEKWGKRCSSLISFPGKVFKYAKDGTLLDYVRFLTRKK